MKELKVKITFTEGVLGTAPADGEVYANYIASKAPDASTIEDEVATLGADEVLENKLTVFHKERAKPFVYDYWVKGFFKGACGFLRNVTGTNSKKLTAYKKKIDGLVFVKERKIFFEDFDRIDVCQRPLRAQTAQGDRVALSASEEIPAGATLTFTIVMLDDGMEKLVREWLDYGIYSGLGQWRNSGKGRFTWEELTA